MLPAGWLGLKQFTMFAQKKSIASCQGNSSFYNHVENVCKKTARKTVSKAVKWLAIPGFDSCKLINCSCLRQQTIY